MKKISFLSMCLAVGLTASAQMDLVKQVDKAKPGTPDEYIALRAQILPALENAESSGVAQTWYVAGKVEYDFFDQMFLAKSVGQQADVSEMARTLVNGYNYYVKALPLDSIPNEKGKIKPKYSKDIINTVIANYVHCYTLGYELNGIGDYKGAYDLWSVFQEIGTNPMFSAKIPGGVKEQLTDTLIAENAFHRACAATLAEMYEEAFAAYDLAYNAGYKDKMLFEYAISTAQTVQNFDQMVHFAELAMPIYGSENSIYLEIIIQKYLQDENYEGALAYVNAAIEVNPENPAYYVARGKIYDNKKEYKTALADYAKAIELDSENAHARYCYGRCLYEDVNLINEEASTKPQKEYEEILTTQIEPMLKEATVHLEKAVELDENQTDAIRYLRNIYYMLGDSANLERVSAM